MGFEVSVRSDVSADFTEDLDVFACRKLWCQVILDQLRLAVSDCRVGPSIDVRRAREWFGTQDFFIVCDLAGLEGSVIYAGARLQISAALGVGGGLGG